jgi:hypothetical protein
MGDLASLKPGDLVLLRGTQGFNRRLWLSKQRVKAVWKNGLILLDGSDVKYRVSNGSPAGKRTGYGIGASLVPWDENLWQQFQREQSEAAQATKLHALGKKLMLLSRDHQEATALWESLPYDVRKLVEGEGDV